LDEGIPLDEGRFFPMEQGTGKRPTEQRQKGEPAVRGTAKNKGLSRPFEAANFNSQRRRREISLAGAPLGGAGLTAFWQLHRRKAKRIADNTILHR